MHFYTSKDSFKSSVGVDSIVELTKDQARRRSHAVESLGDNRYKVLSTIHFKEGEVFGIEQKLGSKLHKNLFGDAKTSTSHYSKSSFVQPEPESKPEPKPEPKPKSVKKSKTKKVFGSRR